MPTPTKIKTRLESVRSLKTTSTSTDEVKNGALLCGLVADDLETSNELRQLAVRAREELQAPLTATAREELILKLNLAMQRFV